MNAAFPVLFAVLSVADPAASVVRSKPGEVTSARITSRTSDFDREEGVALFEGDVRIRYSDDSTMSADRLFVFLSNSNELSRVVAIGRVVISNETRTGTCAMATYRRQRGEIEMFGDSGNPTVRLEEHGENASQIEGTRIKFWLDSEQVEVDNSRIRIENSEGIKAL